MKKRILEIIIILITLISVSIMLFYDKEEGKEFNYDEGKKEVQNNSPVKENKIKAEKEKEPLVEKNTEREKETADKIKNRSNNRHKVMSEENIIREGNNSKGDDMISVFNIEKERIPEELTLLEKAKIFTITKKLSAIDYARVSQCLNSDDDLKGIKEAMDILKLRLNKEDYNKIKSIFSRFLKDTSIIEDNI